jgi:hypothetical protein
MRRIERTPHVIYVDRDRLGSFLCLWLLCLVAPLAWLARGMNILSVLLGSLAVLLAVAAFVLLFRERVFVIDRALGELRVLERTLPWRPARRTQIGLHDLTVWMRDHGADRYTLCVARRTEPPILLRQGRFPEPLRAWGERFAEDLGQSLHTHAGQV